MLTRKRSNSNAPCKKLYGGEIYQSSDNFPPGLLPTKRQVIEHMLNFNHFRKLNTARIVAKELYIRWIWCNVYSIDELSIAQRMYQLIPNFSGLTRYPKTCKASDQYKELETNLLQSAHKLFDIFCYDEEQRKQIEIQYGLRMTSDDHAFFEDTSNIRLGSFSS